MQIAHTNATRIANRGRRSMSEAFDSLATAKMLRGAEFDERQAEAITTGVHHATGADRDKLATKADIANMATKTDLAELEARITCAL